MRRSEQDQARQSDLQMITVRPPAGQDRNEPVQLGVCCPGKSREQRRLAGRMPSHYKGHCAFQLPELPCVTLPGCGLHAGLQSEHQHPDSGSRLLGQPAAASGECQATADGPCRRDSHWLSSSAGIELTARSLAAMSSRASITSGASVQLPSGSSHTTVAPPGPSGAGAPISNPARSPGVSESMLATPSLAATRS
jgi:hypothetical protein